MGSISQFSVWGRRALFGVECFDGALDAAREMVQLAEDLIEEGGWVGEEVGTVGVQGLVIEVLHLQEAELHVDELLGEGVFGRSDRLELLGEVGCDFEGEVVVVDEVFKVAEAVEAVLERTRGGVGGFGHGFLAWGFRVGSHGRLINSNVLGVKHRFSPELKLTGALCGLI